MKEKQSTLQQFEEIKPLENCNIQSLAISSTIDICKQFMQEMQQKEMEKMEQKTQCSFGDTDSNT